MEMTSKLLDGGCYIEANNRDSRRTQTQIVARHCPNTPYLATANENDRGGWLVSKPS